MTAPKRFPDRSRIADARAATEALDARRRARGDTERGSPGRVMARRDMGKLVFLDLVDRAEGSSCMSTTGSHR